jgi:hypothetical protein
MSKRGIQGLPFAEKSNTPDSMRPLTSAVVQLGLENEQQQHLAALHDSAPARWQGEG